MGLTIQAINSNNKVLKEIGYNYTSYENLRINLLDELNIPYEVYEYQPIMHLIKLFNLNKQNELDNEYQEAFTLLMQPFYIDQTLTNQTLKSILSYIDNSDYKKHSHNKALNTFYDFLKYSVEHRCNWYFF